MCDFAGFHLQRGRIAEAFCRGCGLVRRLHRSGDRDREARQRQKLPGYPLRQDGLHRAGKPGQIVRSGPRLLRREHRLRGLPHPRTGRCVAGQGRDGIRRVLRVAEAGNPGLLRPAVIGGKLLIAAQEAGHSRLSCGTHRLDQLRVRQRQVPVQREKAQ